MISRFTWQGLICIAQVLPETSPPTKSLNNHDAYRENPVAFGKISRFVISLPIQSFFFWTVEHEYEHAYEPIYLLRFLWRHNNKILFIEIIPWNLDATNIKINSFLIEGNVKFNEIVKLDWKTKWINVSRKWNDFCALSSSVNAYQNFKEWILYDNEGKLQIGAVLTRIIRMVFCVFANCRHSFVDV